MASFDEVRAALDDLEQAHKTLADARPDHINATHPELDSVLGSLQTLRARIPHPDDVATAEQAENERILAFAKAS
jgi:hypothetical protein